IGVSRRDEESLRELGRNHGYGAGGLSVGSVDIAPGKRLLLPGDTIIPNNLTMPILRVITMLDWSGCCEPDRPHYPRGRSPPMPKTSSARLPAPTLYTGGDGRVQLISWGGAPAIACMATLSAELGYTTGPSACRMCPNSALRRRLGTNTT